MNETERYYEFSGLISAANKALRRAQEKYTRDFGLRSVQYITEKYGGTMHIGTEGDLFVVSLLIPVPRVPAN